MHAFQQSCTGSIMATRKKSEPVSEVQVIDPDSREFRKANSAVGVRVRSGPTLTMMGRRIFNVLLYHAQHQGGPGAHAPKSWGACPNPEDYYWIPSAELAHDSSWGSKDHAMLIQGLQQLQTTLVESDDPTGRFTSVQLLGTVHVLRGSGRRPTMVGWEFPRSTRDILSNPDFYTKLSIYHLTSLKTVAGTALYEIAKRYLTNIGGRTARQHWHWWHDTLTGKPVGSVQYPEFRYFKRDTLTPAIAEVNRTDIRVEMLETRKGRSVTDLQFLVSYAPQGALELPPEPVVDTELIERVQALGFSARQTTELLTQYEAQFVRETLELVQARMADRSKPVLEVPAAFMRMALKDNYVAAQSRNMSGPEASMAKTPPVKTISREDDAIAQERSDKMDAALAAFEGMPEAEQKAWLASFYADLPMARRYRRDGKPFRKTFGGWLVERDAALKPDEPV